MHTPPGLTRWILVDIIGSCLCIAMWFATGHFSWLLGLIVAQVLTVPMLVLRLQKFAAEQNAANTGGAPPAA